jgi:hypothetical protein
MSLADYMWLLVGTLVERSNGAASMGDTESACTGRALVVNVSVSVGQDGPLNMNVGELRFDLSDAFFVDCMDRGYESMQRSLAPLLALAASEEYSSPSRA